MTKLLLALSAASLCSLNVMAQKAINPQLKKVNTTRTAGKTTGVESRLLSVATWTFDGGVLHPADSFHLSYSPNRGWDPILEQWKFDTGIGMNYNGTSYEVGYRMSQSFDAQKRITEQLGEMWDNGNWVPEVKMLYTYSVHGLVSEEDQEYDGSNWTTDFKSTNTYDAQGRITERIDQSTNGSGSLQNAYKTTTDYNAQGLPAVENNYHWNSTAGQWEEGYKRTYYYNGTVNTSTIGESYNMGTWNKSDSTTYTYDNNGNVTEQENRSFMGGTWTNAYKSVNTYDVNNNLISSISMSGAGGSYTPQGQVTSTYNSYNQPLSETYKSWDAASSSFVFDDGDGADYYYYEVFNNSVKDKAIQAGTIRVHPIPAGNTLNLQLKWNETQPATVMLLDMKGKVAGHWTTPTATQHTQTLDISNIPSGIYMLKVLGTKGELHQQVSIVR